MPFLFVGFGGSLGAIVRYLMSIILTQEALTWPLGTLFVNVTGSFLLAYFVEWAAYQTSARIAPQTPMYRLVSTGFFGGYTTFSTYSVEVIAYINAEQWDLALIYVLMTTGACLFGARAGLWVARSRINQP